ncbi:glycosyltransferase family 4 protein [Pedobacter arcticus]|uniref:glycosyltransferase family 4 protein n=1 Tax=Pedobacter arcticus TaxID=752140 RepID=UPI0003029B44|nr:glycosyltransferase family 4 protein [Pedobacter arcticus]
MKKIFIINPWTGRIGPNTFVEGFIRTCLAKKFDVTVLYPCPDSISENLSKLGCKFQYLRFLKLNYAPNALLTKMIYRVFVELILLFMLPFYTFRKNYSLVLVNSEIFVFALNLLSLTQKITVMVHSLSFNSRGFFGTIVLKIQQPAISNYIAVSNIVKQLLIAKGIKKPIFMVYNGIRTNKEEIVCNRNANRGVEILSVIHAFPHKGAHLLIDTLAELNKRSVKFHITVLGWSSSNCDSAYKRSIENEVETKGLSSLITFKHPVDQISIAYNNSDILFHPSKSESFGYTLVEAMSFGLPVVAFNAGGIPEVVSNGVSGILIDPYNINKMADAIVYLINNKEERERMGHAGRLIVEEKFDIDVNTSIFLRNLGLE